MAARDRYPGYHVLDQRGHWDAATRKVVLDRVHNVPEFRHFDDHDRATLQALCDRTVPQNDVPPDERVPVAPWIDNICEVDVPDGFRFDDMPPNATAWKWGLEGLDQTARAMAGKDFADLDEGAQYAVLEAIRGGSPAGEVWQRMPARRWWVYVALRQITGIYYSHPLAWDEIGFGGPAYPRGYFALNHGDPEPWEVRETGGRGEGETRGHRDTETRGRGDTETRGRGRGEGGPLRPNTQHPTPNTGDRRST